MKLLRRFLGMGNKKDRLDAGTEAQLQTELHLEHSLDDVLESWPGRKPASLVIDALDASRGKDHSTSDRPSFKPQQSLAHRRLQSGAGSTARDVFGHPPVVMAVAFCLLNPLAEELVVRAYLMTEMMELTGSTALVVILSVVVQFFLPSVFTVGQVQFPCPFSFWFLPRIMRIRGERFQLS